MNPYRKPPPRPPRTPRRHVLLRLERVGERSAYVGRAWTRIRRIALAIGASVANHSVIAALIPTACPDVLRWPLLFASAVLSWCCAGALVGYLRLRRVRAAMSGVTTRRRSIWQLARAGLRPWDPLVAALLAAAAGCVAFLLAGQPHGGICLLAPLVLVGPVTFWLAVRRGGRLAGGTATKGSTLRRIWKAAKRHPTRPDFASPRPTVVVFHGLAALTLLAGGHPWLAALAIVPALLMAETPFSMLRVLWRLPAARRSMRSIGPEDVDRYVARMTEEARDAVLPPWLRRRERRAEEREARHAARSIVDRRGAERTRTR